MKGTKKHAQHNEATTVIIGTLYFKSWFSE